METINEEEPDYVQLKVLRGIHTRYVELEPDWEQLGSDANGQPRAEP